MYRLGLIGYPLGHSLSPTIHEAALRTLGLEGEYRLYPILPVPEGREDLENLLQRVQRGVLQGLNVTIPHKRVVLPWIHSLSAAARETGAVNTIYATDGQISGDNTDIAGFQHDLSNHLPANTRGGRALVLGAGGSARAVVYALMGMDWQVTIAARRLGQAEQLIGSMLDAIPSQQRRLRAQLRAIELSAARLAEAINDSQESDTVSLIVNTTPVGMAPDCDASPWPDGIPFPPEAFVYDLIYNPSETLLVHTSRQAGLEACDGLGMLVEQAALSLERWTGLTAPREVMMEAATRSRLDTKSSKRA